MSIDDFENGVPFEERLKWILAGPQYLQIKPEEFQGSNWCELATLADIFNRAHKSGIHFDDCAMMVDLGIINYELDYV